MSKPLDRHILDILPLNEQPETEYVVIPPGGRTPIAITGWSVDDREFFGYRAPEVGVIVAMPREADWVVYSRKLVRALSQEEVIRLNHETRKAVEKVYDELEPGTGKAAVLSMEELMKAMREEAANDPGDTRGYL